MEFINAVGPHSLELFGVSWSEDDLGGKTSKDLDSEPLKSLSRVADAFPDPDGDVVNVAIQLPYHFEPFSSVKGQFGDFFQSKIATMAPSSMALPEEYTLIQADTNQRLLDDRPYEDEVPPLSLLYDGFGTFLDIASGSKPSSIHHLHSAIDAFATDMCPLYPLEHIKRDTLLPRLNHIFRSDDPETPFLEAVSLGNITTDAYNIVASMAGHIVIEVKNELPGMPTHPHAEGAGYFAWLLKDHLNHPQFLHHWRVPFLGIVIIGIYIEFHGFVWLGGKIRSAILVPPVPCLRTAAEGQSRQTLYRAFAAAIQLKKDIIHDTQRHLKSPPPLISRDRFLLPSVSRLSKHGSDGYFHFELVSYYGQRPPHCQIFAAHLPGKPECRLLVKFSQAYCLELHEYCFKQGHAPQIYAFEFLPGGWYGIAMEYIEGAHSFNNLNLEKDIRALVKGFHDEGWVHGDLRDVNILCTQDRFWLIDFDWGGKDGEVEYPTGNLALQLTSGRKAKDWKIRREDDLRALYQMFTCLEVGIPWMFLPMT